MIADSCEPTYRLSISRFTSRPPWRRNHWGMTQAASAVRAGKETAEPRRSVGTRVRLSRRTMMSPLKSAGSPAIAMTW